MPGSRRSRASPVASRRPARHMRAMASDASPASSSATPRRGDLTRGPIARTLLLFALPTLGANVLQSLNGSVNSVWVGRFLGENALAATSNANLVMFLMFSALFGFGLAATILIGQSVGRRDIEGARRVLATAVGFFAILSVAVAIAGYLATPALLRLLGTPAPVQPLAIAYLRLIFAGMPASFLMVILSMGLRGTGDSITPLIAMILNVALDAGLNPVFILGLGGAPRLGIAGSSTATAIAGYVTCAALVALIYARDLPLRLRGRELRMLRPDPAILKVMFVKGIPIGLQMVVMSVSALTMIGLVNRVGAVTVAAYGIAQQLWTYIQMPALAVGAAVSAMVAQNIGAGRWERVSRIAVVGIGANIVMTGSVVLALALVDRALLGLFLPGSSPALAIAAHINTLASWSFLLFGVTIVLFATVRANGAVFAPLIVLGIALFPVRLGFAAWALPRYGTDALWISFPIGSVASLLMALGYYRWGGWRELRVAPVGRSEARDGAMTGGEPGGRIQPTA